ncbi:MAG: VCBS repeat-containing protein [Desulfobacterales bacterium]|jgi:hypothetical protein
MRQNKVLSNRTKIRLAAGLVIFIYSFGLSGCGGVGGAGGSGEAYYFGLHAIGDLDGDGGVDIAVAGSLLREYGAWNFEWYEVVTVLLNDTAAPSVSFTVDTYLTVAECCFEDVAIGDLDDDGLPDIITENGSNIFVFFQDPSLAGTFSIPVKINVGSSVNDLAVADLNEDGLNDLAIAGRNNHLSILFQDSKSPGTFFPIRSLAIESTSVAAQDLNADTLEDLVVTSTGSEVVRLIFQDPASFGNFLPPVNLSTGFRPLAVKIGDIDKDGRPDLVVGNENAANVYDEGTVSILLQDMINPGDFLAAVNYAVAFKASEISLGDLSDDGLLDIAVVGSFDSVDILLQDLTNIGTFLSAKNYAFPGTSPWSVAIGDVNADTLNDLIVSGWSSGVAVRYQDPSAAGTFLPIETIYNPG